MRPPVSQPRSPAVAASLALAALYGQYDATAFSVALILAGSCGAFLVYNFNPASIFMRYCGSLVIGFMLAVLSLYFSETQAAVGFSNFMVPVMLLLELQERPQSQPDR